LARHHGGAGSAERAVGHWRRAAELAIGRSANLEAIAHCEQAEVQLQAIPPSVERARAELEVLLAKGVAVRAAKGYSAPEAERVFLRACELCEELGDRVRSVHALRGLWAFYYVAARWRDAARVADRLDAAAEGLEDRVVLAVREFVIGATLLFRGEPPGASLRLRGALKHYDEGDRDAHIRHSGHDAATLVRGHLVLAQWFLGLPEQALRTSREGLEIARRVAHPFSLAQMLAFSAVASGLSRDWAAAEALAAEAREISARYGLATHLALGTIASGIAVAARGDTVEGAGLIREGVAALHRTGGGFFTPLAMGHLALTLCSGGDAGAALEAADEAVRVTRASKELCWEAEALRVRGEVRRAAGAAAGEAEVDLRAAVEIARRQGASALELRAATSLGRLWAAGSERRKAYDMLAAIHGRFAEGLDTADLRDARALLDALR
jgi:tetratricopeptide (TPR) repeat protein